jgi:hypothetical protein
MAAPEGNQFALGNEGGRPTKYKDEYVEQAYKLCLLGATDKELADFFEVNEDTINEWKKVHLEFSESLKNGKALADANVADRLYQRAMGFEHDSEEIKVMFDKETNEQYIERVPIRKIYAPDSVAAIFWLKNRQKDKWRDKTEVGHSGSLGITLIEGERDDKDEPITD